LKAIEAQAELARLDLDRYQRLITQNASSRDQFDRANAELAGALARAQALQAIIDKKTLRAPFDAYSGLHQLQPGQYLGDNTLITVLVGMDQLVWVDFTLAQQQTLLPIGTTISAYARGLLATPLTGKLIAKDVALNKASRNLRMRAAFKDHAGVLKPGAIVDLEIPLATTQTVTVLPATAIRRDTFGSYVYVIVDEKPVADTKSSKTSTEHDYFRAQKRVVTLGPEQQQRTIIVSGLKAGERVAANGSYKLGEGMLVQVKSVSTAEADNSSVPAASGKSHD
jgi:membrane fusion protein (multidrug efflux system)